MTPQEQDMINGLIDRVTRTQLAEKDADAERLLQTGLSRNPDSVYILAQTVLVQQYALDQAQAELKAARSEVEQLRQAAAQHPKPATSFLGSIFGSHDTPPPPPQQPQPQPQRNYGQQLAPAGTGYAPVPGYAPQPGYQQQPGYGVPQAGGSILGGGGGFLRGAAQTAAGVAAGALAFEGVESLLHGFGERESGGFGGGGGGRPEEIVNNYYGDSSDRDRGGDRSNFAGSSDNDPNDRNPGDNLFTDSSDSNDRNNFAGSANDTSSDSGDDTDDSSFDDGTDSDNSSLSDSDDSFSDDSSLDDTSDNSF